VSPSLHPSSFSPWGRVSGQRGTDQRARALKLHPATIFCPHAPIGATKPDTRPHGEKESTSRVPHHTVALRV